MTKPNEKKERRLLQATWARVAAASTTLCTTLIILAPYFDGQGGGTGPKIPPAAGES